MAIITISRGSYSRGKEVAEKTAQRLGYACVSRETLLEASKEFDLPEIKLLHAIDDAPSFLDRFTVRKEKFITYIRAALLKHMKKGEVVYHGFACHYFTEDIPYAFRVRIISQAEERARLLMERDRVSRKEALRRVRKVDEQRRKWARKLYGIDPWDPGLYDLVLTIDRVTVDDAVESLCRMVKRPQFRVTPEAEQALGDLALAAEVQTHLIGLKQKLEVCVERGFVYLKTHRPPSRKSDLIQRTGHILKSVPEAKGIRIVTGEELEERYACVSDLEMRSTQDSTSTFFSEL